MGTSSQFITETDSRRVKGNVMKSLEKRGHFSLVRASYFWGWSLVKRKPQSIHKFPCVGQ